MFAGIAVRGVGLEAANRLREFFGWRINAVCCRLTAPSTKSEQDIQIYCGS